MSFINLPRISSPVYSVDLRERLCAFFVAFSLPKPFSSCCSTCYCYNKLPKGFCSLEHQV